jgi:hypothetical protein
MTRIIPLVCVWCSFVCFTFAQTASNPTAWDYLRDKRRKPVDQANIAAQYVAQDFAPLLLLHDQSWRLGYIGKEYQRFYIYFTSISKDSSNPYRYRILGKSKVKDNVCDFAGTMQLSWIRRVHASNECENEIRPAFQGISFFSYEFKEDPKQSHSGFFRGTAAILWYLGKKGELRYDDTWNCADSFTNNCFVGTWTSYNAKATRPCNWGDARIPFSGDLDNGAGEFHPHDKYLGSGWGTYPADVSVPWWK